MWLIFGLCAILFALLQLVWAVQDRNAAKLRFASLGFTAMTLCAFYSDGAMRVEVEDWAGLMDIMPTLSKFLWVCTVGSILVNAYSLFKETQEE